MRCFRLDIKREILTGDSSLVFSRQVSFLLVDNLVIKTAQDNKSDGGASGRGAMTDRAIK